MHKNAYGQTVFDSESEALAYARGEVKQEPTGDGLIRREVQIDPWTRRIAYEYELAPNRDKKTGWMSPYIAPVLEQLRIANSNAAATEISKGQPV